jgi:protein ImuA
MPESSLAALAATVRAIEGRAVARVDVPVIATGATSLDKVLGGGLLRGALHEIAPVRAGDAPAALGVALIGAGRAVVTEPGRHRAVIWVTTEAGLAEDGLPYGPGLAALGFGPAPAQGAAPGAVPLVIVRAARPLEACWAAEEALDAGSPALLELRGGGLDLPASRRLALAAGRAGVPGFVLRPQAPPDPLATATRLAVAAAPAVGRAPAFRLAVEKNRSGPLAARLDVLWQAGRLHDAPASRTMQEAASTAAGLPPGSGSVVRPFARSA